MTLPISTAPDRRARYAQAGGMHRIVPAAVARPTTLDELVQLVAWCAEVAMPITPRGAGTSMAGAAVGAGMVVDLTALSPDDVAIDVAARRATVAPAVTLGTLERQATPHGLRFGPDPSSAAWATVGGVIGTNAAGARTYRLGAVDRWVEAVTLLTGDGPLVLRRGIAADPHHPAVARFRRDAIPVLDRHRAAVLARWPHTRKNTLGYGLSRFWASGDLLDLVVGAEGTLGIVTSAELRLEPIPPRRATMQITLPRPDLAAVVAHLSPHDPVAIELLDRSFLQVTGQATAPGAAMLLVDFEDDVEARLARRLEEAGRAVASTTTRVEVARTVREIESLWAVRHQASPALARIDDGRRSLQVIEDGCVPVERLADYLDLVEQTCARFAVDVVMFGHAGDGHVHVNLLPDLRCDDALERVEQIAIAVHAAIRDLGGTPAGEHGTGRLRASLLEPFLGTEAVACHAAIRAAFDPTQRWNPEALSPATAPFEHLKVGRDAAALPDGVSEALGRIEGERRWGESRWDPPADR